MAHIKLINGQEWTPDTDIKSLLKQWKEAHKKPEPIDAIHDGRSEFVLVYPKRKK